MGTLHEKRCAVVVIDRLIDCRIRHFSYRRPREKQNTYFMFNNFIEKSQHL